MVSSPSPSLNEIFFPFDETLIPPLPPLPTLIVLVLLPFVPVCVAVKLIFSPLPTFKVPTESPETLGLSSHSNFKETSPFPLTIISLPSPLNFAVTPDEVDWIFNEAFTSNPSLASSSNSIVLPLSLTLLPAVEDAPSVLIG